jgi:hypothetical protein
MLLAGRANGKEWALSQWLPLRSPQSAHHSFDSHRRPASYAAELRDPNATLAACGHKHTKSAALMIEISSSCR